jgi:2Fe-2S ferredoxin
MKIKFLPQNIEVEGNSEKSLLQIATENHLEIRSICKGVPSCAECRIKITQGDQNVIPPNKTELGLLGTNYFIDGRRLSCQVHCFGDVTVDLAEQIDRQDNQVKKIRGFRSTKNFESRAVNDMMLLNVQEQTMSESASEIDLKPEVLKGPPKGAQGSSARSNNNRPQNQQSRSNQQQRSQPKKAGSGNAENRPQQQGQKPRGYQPPSQKQTNQVSQQAPNQQQGQKNAKFDSKPKK